MEKIKKIEKYLSDFFSNRFDDIDFFYRAVHQQRTYGIYKLERGTELMDFVISIHSNIEEHLYYDHIIPQKFVTPERFLTFLNNFKKYLNEHQCLLDINFNGEDTDHIIVTIQEFKNDLVEMIDYIKRLYDMEDSLIPYQELRYNLITKDVPGFITTIKSILASVSYAIAQIHEGYFHSNVHLILKLLGFEILSEELTNNGRIDAVIRFSDVIYILEFKFGQNKDLSKVAMQQILDKNYAQKFIVEHKEIIGIGVSFDEMDRNVNGFVYQRLSD